jgi:para-nitrobenzyl esterase
MLTRTRIEAARPRAKPIKLFDGRGWYLEIAPSGGRWWRFKYRFAGKERRVSLGVYPAIGLKAARQRLEQARKLVAGGIDPSAQRQAAKRALVESCDDSFEALGREQAQRVEMGPDSREQDHRAARARYLPLARAAWIGATLAAVALVCARPAAAQIGIVTVTSGRVGGVTADGITSFKGIPFAAPPVGNLRWRAPQPVRPWSGIKKADHFGPECMQASVFGQSGARPAGSEDCLYLNVWTAAKSAHDRLPVMVWIYGGGYFAGSTSDPSFDGTRLAKQDAVLVSISYRLGALGFLADPQLDTESPHHVSGNYGLLDMIAALKWVKANIAKFGGDPSRVTIFGQSAGGFSVSLLTQSPLANGLFERAIAESGANFGPVQGDTRHNPFTLPAFLPVWRAEALGKRFLAVLGVHTIAAARALDAQAILTAQRAHQRTFSWFVPVRDGYVLPSDGYALYEARSFNDTPVLIGTNSDEGSFFEPPHTTPRQFEAQVRAVFGSYAASILATYPHATDAQSSQAQRDVFRDYFLAWRAWTWARLQSLKGEGKAYLYYFDVPTPPDAHGSPHGAELPYVFDNLPTPAPSAARALATLVSGYWVNFARTGNPNGPGLPRWPAFNASTRQVMVFDAHPSARLLPNRRKLEAFDAYFRWRREEAKKKQFN